MIKSRRQQEVAPLPGYQRNIQHCANNQTRVNSSLHLLTDVLSWLDFAVVGSGSCIKTGVELDLNHSPIVRSPTMGDAP